MADGRTERIVLHIGTHKTGSTSLQRFLRDQADGLLATAGIGYPTGFLLEDAHAELPLLAASPERLWPARIRLPETQRPTWLAVAADRVREQVRASPEAALVYSHEDLSYLRSPEELERLREVLQGPTIDVVVFLRSPDDFLRSYREQLVATGFELSDDPSSFAYVAPDSWLTDYNALVGAYRRCFGEEHVQVIDYDDAMRRDGSVIPSFARILGLPPESLPPLEPYFLNLGGTQQRLSDEQLASVRRRIIEQAP